MTTIDTDLSVVEEELAEAMRLTHIVAPSDNKDICHALGNGPEIGARNIVAYARLNGLEVAALCGYRWVPDRDPTKYDTCEACLEEAHKRMEAGE